MVMGFDLDAREIKRQARISLDRLLPRLEGQFVSRADAQHWASYKSRLQQHFEALFTALFQLYGRRYDFFFHLETMLAMTARMWVQRPPEFKELDAEREKCPDWFLSHRMIGGVCYVDLFAGSLDGVRDKIPYFRELGLTYLHLMPLFLAPEGDSDGGYAVSNYHEVNPALGTVDELLNLARDLRRNGISLTLDFVLNHTSDEHEWARMARAGNETFREFYSIFGDRTMPDAYGRTLRDIFPDLRPGSFTYVPDLDSWIWTTFNSFQWDLNYANPEVFTAMAEEMLGLANRGVEILRFDALAFIWKEMGTSCENLPQAHFLIQAFNAIARIAAPALLFKSEAIVHPAEVVKYVREDECQLSYNPLLMALLWEALATREVRLLQTAMRERFHIPPHCSWVNYVRSHDDIGWTFDDGDAARLGINAFDHRQFLNSFYTGKFDGSFARGLPFQENPRTGDARVCGTTASLAGLELALLEGDDEAISLAVARIVLLYSVILSIGGIPLIYLGDEMGSVNAYDFARDPAKARDTRWVHRPVTDWTRMEQRNDADSVEGRVFRGVTKLIGLRQRCSALTGNSMEVVDAGNPQVFAYLRRHDDARLLVLANFSERSQRVAWNALRLYGLSYRFHDVISGVSLAPEPDMVLPAYETAWLIPE
ncbi:MAG: alpha-amylase family glycosyl hydrolase [Chloroflexota bacterium]